MAAKKKKRNANKRGRSRSSDSLIVASFDDAERASLMFADAPRNIFAVGRFDLHSNISIVQGTKADGKPLSVRKDKQINQLLKVMESPLKGSYCYAISGFPNDGMAKAVAGHILVRAKLQHEQMASNRESPCWHTLTGVYADKFRDKQRKPAMLVISNITPEITPQKLEKLRDILELYSNIPRIVVMSGCEPVEFFTQKLFYPLNKVLYIKKTITETQI